MSRTLVFQGDSITDASRDRNQSTHLGLGYVSIIATQLMTQHPELDLNYVNRGVSGDRSKDLVSDWKERCLDLEPELFSLYIGVNNTWRRYDQNESTTEEVFAEELRFLLDSTFKHSSVTPETSILIEPFVLDEPAGSKGHWREEDLDAKAATVKSLAQEYGTAFLPLQSIFDQALALAPAAFWAQDGVHPTPAGHYLIAQEWLNIMKPVLEKVALSAS
jgi:lysophospholipase L1-like esterase